MSKYPISDEKMLELLKKYPFLKHRKFWEQNPTDVYDNDKDNIEHNKYKIWDNTGWEDLWKNRYLSRLFKLYDTWDDETKSRFYITDIKEKYGNLRIYTSFSTRDNLESIAMDLSKYTCAECGKEPRTEDGKRVIWTTGGWITNLCRDCVRKYVLENAVGELPEEDIQRYVDNMKHVQETPFGYLECCGGVTKKVTYKETPDNWLEIDKEEIVTEDEKPDNGMVE